MTRPKVVGKVGNFNLCFRPERLPSHAGVVLLHDFAQRLGVAQVLDDALAVKARERGYPEREAVGSLVDNTILGGTWLSDLEVVRGAQGTQEVLEVETVMAPTTAGDFLRKCDMGDVHDLQRVILRLPQRVRPHQGATTCTSDLDSSISEQASHGKEGATKAYKGEIGDPPLFAFWAEAGELLFSHLRRGSAHTARNAVWFLQERRKRLPAAPLKRRADSGFYSQAGVAWCEQAGSPCTITADQPDPLLQALATLPARRGQPRPEYDWAEVAELRYQPVGWGRPSRSIGQRELAERKTGELYWKYHGVVTNDAIQPAAVVMGWHLQHADMGNALKEHQSGFGLEKLPTQKFPAKWAYLLMGQIACNLVAWCKRLVLPPSYQRTTSKTMRPHLLNLAGKLVHSARRCVLVLSGGYR